MSITQKALEQLAELVGYTVKRTEPGSQYFVLDSPSGTFQDTTHTRDRAFMHLLWVVLTLGITTKQVREAVTWEPDVTLLKDGERVYSDVSPDASVDAMVSRFWKRPGPSEK